MANQHVGEEQEALFHSSPCALYYVQSPSAASHTNSHPASESALLSPFTQESFPNNRNRDEVSRFTLSRYSSSRGSNNSFLQEKKAGYESRVKKGERQRLRIVGVNDGEEDGEGTRSGMWRFVSLDPSSSCCCVAFQVTWRLMFSVGFAFLVFFLATKPPQPNVSFKVFDLYTHDAARISLGLHGSSSCLQITSVEQFSLREGLDNTGVVTKILTCNCSMEMAVDNYSKVFGLHVRPSAMEMAFEHMKFASSLVSLPPAMHPRSHGF